MSFQAELLAQHINIVFQQDFDYDDVDTLAECVMSKFTDYKVIEVIPGADRMNYRIYWANNNFVLNFEVYSQSCWLEVESGIAPEALTTAYQALAGIN